MNEQKRILSVQDISCLGKCSNTVALPVLNAAGHECVMLPTALLSTHTAGFTGFTFLDLTEEMGKILAHYDKMALRFDAVVTGYFGSAEQITLLRNWMAGQGESLRRYIDPVLGDGGKLYSIYDDHFVAAMRELVKGADVITPNRTEACLVCGIPYEGEDYNEEQLSKLFACFREMGVGTAVITGVRTGEDEICACACDLRNGGKPYLIRGRYVKGSFHGAGDLFTAALVGKLENGAPMEEAITTAVDLVSESLAGCIGSEKLYGPMFEQQLTAFF